MLNIILHSYPKGKNKSYEHINFEIIDDNTVVVEIADDALFVDKRVFYREVLFISEYTNGKISDDQLDWYNHNEFKPKISNYIDSSLDVAVEKSIQEMIS
ncbi:MAG TPA: hypothetical protein GX497_01835 [Bacillus bacterium]|nr:hypothetical protein [Bacillus sp. (in: firmicutes)]